MGRQPDKTLLMCSVTAVALCLTACGGGGSPSAPATTPTAPVMSVPSTVEPVILPDASATPTPIITPSTSGAEFLRNPGLAQMNVQSAWSAGATGAGQKIAVIDGAADGSSFDLTGKVTADSVDIISGRSAADTTSRHASQIAGVIAANFNSVGTVGAAYNAQILSIRADAPGSCATDCSFNLGDLARGVDYAVSHGAKIINLSLGDAAPSGSAMEAALKRAVDAGVVVVASAGNEGAAETTYPARYAVDARFKGAIIAAGALDATGNDIAGFSNRAGSAAAGYLLAPGQSIRTDCTTAGVCTIVSGTSFAAPHISAGLALLLEAFPNLTGRQAVDILLRSATDLGAPGTDAVYGRGKLNMTRAMQPLGALSVDSASGATYEAASGGAPATAVLGAAFGGSFQNAAPNLETVAFDDYRRRYSVNLADAYAAQGRRSAIAPQPEPARQSSQVIDLADGAALQLTARKSYTPLYMPGGMTALAEAGREDAVLASYRSGGLNFDLWSGKAGLAPASAQAATDAYSNLASARQMGRANYTVGGWNLAAEQGFGARGDDPVPDYIRNANIRPMQGTSYSKVTAARDGSIWKTSVTFGLLNESGGPLGSAMTPGSAFALRSTTHYVQGQVSWRATSLITLTGAAAAGDTDAQGGVMTLKARSTSWSLKAEAACNAVCSGVSFSVSQPVRVSAATLSAWLAKAPALYADPLTYSRRSTALSPDGRELDLNLTTWRDLGRAGLVSLQANAFTQEGNRQDAPLNLGVMAGWTRRF